MKTFKAHLKLKPETKPALTADDHQGLTAEQQLMAFLLT